MESPIIVAPRLAEALRADPIAAAQIKEHIPEAELLELLGLTRHLKDWCTYDLTIELNSRGYEVS